MPWSLRTTYLVLTSQLRITNVAALGSGTPHCRVERQWVRRNKRRVWGKVLRKPRVGGRSHFCSTPSLVLVLHEEASRLEKEAVVRTRWPVKAQSLEGWAQAFRGLEATLPLYQGVCADRERAKLEAISSTIKLTMNRDHRQQKRTFWPEMLLNAHRQGDPSFSHLPWLDTSQSCEARLRKGGRGTSQSNETQPNSIQPCITYPTVMSGRQRNQALSPL